MSAVVSLVPLVLLGLGVLVVLFLLAGIRFIPNNKVGIVEMRISPLGSIDKGVIALKGEAGFQPGVLRGGLHYLLPIQYDVHIVPLVTIPQGKIGYVFARDGQALPSTQTLASNASATDFQDVREFLQKGGQRGPQRKIVREGTYALNLAQFVVITEERLYYLPLEKGEEEVFQRMAKVLREREGFAPVVIKGTDDNIGIVTVHDGPSLPSGQIIAPTVGEDASIHETYHNSFQDPERFLAAGGLRGRQLQVLVEGTYYINRVFATVEMVPKTVVDVGTVGVVVSYTGEVGKDLSGADYKHGELVSKGTRGVWSEPLLPGKYAFNTYAAKCFMVPTTNFILKWTRGEVGSHRFDENLAEVALITKDAFEPSLPLSVVVHIDYRKAPLVIQRFGDIKKLVEQTLDPMVSAYFKNIGQTRTLIQLIQDRSEIQKLSGEQMKEKFAQYNLELQEVLIGTPTSGPQGGQIEQILLQLRSRQIATEQVETYNRQQQAAVKERELREAEARAKQQTNITESELSIMVQSNNGKADLARAQQEATKIQTLAGAEAGRIRMLGEGEAGKILALAGAEAQRAARVGVAQALAIEEQVRAYGGPRFQLTQMVMNRFSEAIQASGVDVVPRIVVGGSGHDGNGGGQLTGNVMQALLTLLLSEKMGGDASAPTTPRSAEAEAVRRQIREGMEDGKQER
ncbi:MAG TPA: SPFH domain-containing protein [Methylomirabilota bacterium]|nr:SPFH domain-containing protein [Methylomirabilota bacterium]